MIYELWLEIDNGEDGATGATFLPANHSQKDWLTQGSEKTWEVEADTWEEALVKYHEYMGWEPYKPLYDKDGNRVG